MYLLFETCLVILLCKISNFKIQVALKSTYPAQESFKRYTSQETKDVGPNATLNLITFTSDM